jgi:hypothetical protein
MANEASVLVRSVYADFQSMDQLSSSGAASKIA